MGLLYRKKVLIILQVKEVIYNRIRHYVWAVYAQQKMVSKHTHTLSLPALREHTHIHYLLSSRRSDYNHRGRRGKRKENKVTLFFSFLRLFIFGVRRGGVSFNLAH